MGRVARMDTAQSAPSAPSTTRTRLPRAEQGMTAEGRETYHVENGPGYVLPCWCDLGRDHTLAEFMAALGDD